MVCGHGQDARGSEEKWKVRLKYVEVVCAYLSPLHHFPYLPFTFHLLSLLTFSLLPHKKYVGGRIPIRLSTPNYTSGDVSRPHLGRKTTTPPTYRDTSGDVSRPHLGRIKCTLWCGRDLDLPYSFSHFSVNVTSIQRIRCTLWCARDLD